jgi:uncharacterized protein
MRALLDINVLIALHDRDHIHHERAALWLEAHIEEGWASCPLTQNGCLRIMSQPGYSSPQPLGTLMEMLKRSTSTAFHQLWSNDISLLDDSRFQHPHIHGPQQLTDIYLLGLALRNQGRLVSFDKRIALNTVHGAKAEHLVAL